MGNSSGSSRERRTLYYYDRMPKSVRHAIANARFDWATGYYLKLFESGKLSAADIVKRIEFDDKSLSARDRLKVWGPDYPRLPGEFGTPRVIRKRR